MAALQALAPRSSSKVKKKKKMKKEFEMCRWAARDIALWIAYEGDAYSGFAEQREVGGVETVEKQLFAALEKCCLIEGRESCRYSRCGRTDRGVSAQGQVVGLRVRSVLKAEEAEDGLAPRLAHPGAHVKPGVAELSYCEILNRVLPPDVRAIAWRSVAPEFSARFSAAARTYRYFFRPAAPKTARNYDVDAMRDAARRLVGDHDFRNLCKMDVEHVKNYRRVVYDARIVDYGGSYYFEITGQAFLWHMVRCVVAVLFLVGEGREPPDVVDALLDVRNTPRRPQYLPASEAPLVLNACSFDTLTPTPTPDALARLTDHYEKALHDALTLAARRTNARDELFRMRVRRVDLDVYLGRVIKADDDHQQDTMLSWGDAIVEIRPALRAKLDAAYAPLLRRQGGKTYDERVDAMGPRKREKLEANERKRQESAPIDQVRSLVLLMLPRPLHRRPPPPPQVFHADKRRYG
ncbi:hypothetical protein CTAYLR_009711 [Chrysophaeum taylorii]|uniref:tRNA pseudouridine synthase n=1 Tax=Chrysophaeum taylorii TaxID=2483200 RepID=A0AAD7XPP6_9STRA|nr:hypothetical protein CTAYLR_009711 [Chrysophaeum taylorii]